MGKLASVDIETECALGCTKKSECETKGHALIPHESRITCIGVYIEGGYRRVFRGENMIKDLETLVIENDLKLLGHNFNFDIKQLSYHAHGYTNSLLDYWAEDTKLLAYVTMQKIPDNWLKWYEEKRKEENERLPRGASHRKAGKHSLKTLAPYFLGVDPFWEDPSDHNNDEYVLKDAEYTLYLYFELYNSVTEEELEFYYDRQLPWTKELLKAGLEGVRIDKEKLKAKKEEEEAKEVNAFNKVKANWNLSDDFNLNSPQQLLKLLRDDMGYDTTKFEGGYSVDKEVLNRLSKEHPEVKDLLQYRKSHKLSSTYLVNYERFMSPVDEKIHCDFNPTGARTGRISSSSPNLQNQPPETRDLFIPKEGCSFVTRDLSGIEPVFIAYYTQDQALLDILQSGKNFHSFVTSLIFPYVDCKNEEVEELYPEERAVTKTADLSIFYGSGAKRLHSTMFTAGFTSYERKDCKRIVANLRDYFKGVWNFKLALDELLESGEVVYNFLGRPIKYLNVDEIYMKGFNGLIQGSASDMVQEAIKNYNHKMNELNIDSKVLITVHDEILAEAPDEYVEKCDYILDQCMTDFNLTRNGNEISLQTEGQISKHWTK